MISKQLFEMGKVREAQEAVSAYLRDHPSDVQQRTFLFELLCFSGDYDRAQKQLSVLAQGGKETELAAILYYSALHAEKTRHELFQKHELPASREADRTAFKGTLNGKPFQSISDADPDIHARLEVFAAGSYMWLPFEHIASIQIDPPRRLRDTLWAPAFIRTAPAFGDKELGEVLIPAIYPFSWRHPDGNVWLGRHTEWGEDDDGREYPLGQRLWIVDGEEVPLLEVRSLDFAR